MQISIIVAMDEQGLIGAGNDLPWRLPADLKRFKRLTMGSPLVMGRKTHESIGRALPGRLNIVVTTQGDAYAAAPGCVVVSSFDEALVAAGAAPEVFVIGGAMLYARALPLAGKIHLTRLAGRYHGDTWFPAVAWDEWQEVAREDHPAGPETPAHSFIELARETRPR